jgi:hypothetical protein
MTSMLDAGSFAPFSGAARGDDINRMLSAGAGKTVSP